MTEPWLTGWQLLDDPEVFDIFSNAMRRYWRANVKKHFSKTETNYPAGNKSATYALYRKNRRKWAFPKIPKGESSQLKLYNALRIDWNPILNTVNMRVKKIPVYKINNPAYNDLVEMLRLGTPKSKKAYIPAINVRVPHGYRGGTTNEQWVSWWSEFIPVMDNHLERLATYQAGTIADKIVNNFSDKLAMALAGEV